MRAEFTSRFQSELNVLSRLFGADILERRLDRMIEIFDYTEAKWHEYVALIGGNEIRYLLIAEAPPWSGDGQPQYFLDPSSRPRTLMRALCKVFEEAMYCPNADRLRIFASKGLLMVDSIPFAMEYSSKRSSGRYLQLVRMAITTYLQPKLNMQIPWSPNLRIAFTVSRNAQAILGAVDHLTISGRHVSISANMVAVNGAGYPGSSQLKNVFELSST